MQDLYPKAKYKPLGKQTESRITPRILIVHTMAGYLKSSDGLFRRGGFDGVEAHFGIGGPWDGKELDGAVWQWQKIAYSADAQGAGNAYATSVETSDGGQYLRKWSEAQVEALIDLGVWWCQQTGAPAKLVDATSDHGFGYHCQFKAWNPNNHACPGVTRINQLKKEVLPEIARRLGKRSSIPAFPLRDGYYFGPKSGPKESVSGYFSNSDALTKWQKRAREIGLAVKVTGHYDDSGMREEVIKFQKSHGLTRDGLVGPDTWATTWKHSEK